VIKVCHLTSVHPRNDVRIFYRQCVSLSKNYDVSLVVADGLGSSRQQNINIIDVGKPPNRLFRILFSTWKVFFRSLKTKSKIFHFHDPELFFVGLLLRFIGKNVIFDVHENIVAQIRVKTWIPIYFRAFLSSIFNIINYISVSFFSIILAEKSYLSLYKKYKSKNNIQTVLNYPNIDSLIEFRQLERNGNEFFYIGGVSNNRGLDVLIDAAKILHKKNLNFKFHLIGMIRDDFFIDDFPELKKKIIFYGRKDFKSGYIISKKCIAGLAILKPIDNYINSYPTKIFEYMTIGLPVITSNFKLYEEVVKNNNTGICVNPLSPKDLADVLERFINLEYDIKKMSELGVKVVKEKYSWKFELKKLLKLYKSLEN